MLGCIMLKGSLPRAALAGYTCLHPCIPVLKQQIRNTFILKRRHPIILSKIGAKLPRRLRPRHFIYDLVEDSNVRKKEPISVILTTYVSGLGDKGDIVSVKPNFARQNLLLPGKAVYASPENIAEYTELKKDGSDKPTYSSPNALRMMTFLAKRTIVLPMNDENPWTVEPWHIRVAFRKSGIIVPEDAIELPSQPISGPDPAKEGKEFAVNVTINKTEIVPVRIRLLHCNGKPETAFPSTPQWFSLECEPILEEQAELLSSMPRSAPLPPYKEKQQYSCSL